MGITLTLQASAELWEKAEQRHAPITSIDRSETIRTVPSELGSGFVRDVALQPGMELCIFDRIYRDVTYRLPESQHPVQFMVLLSGIVDSGDFLYQDAHWGYIGGSGIQHPVSSFFPKSQRQMGVNIHMQPRLLAQFFGFPIEELSPELKYLIPGKSHSQYVFSPRTTGAIRAVVQQIIDCPFSGVTKQLYLQGKILELMTLQIAGVMEGDVGQRPRKLKPDTVTRLHQVAAIVRSHLENPLSQTELANAVGMSDRTLRRGFKQLFGVTVVGYLTQQRIERAEQTLREGNCTVAEVANQVGYAHLGHFAAAFKRHFGITPSQCLRGKRVEMG